eukprot:gnl/TRDRNA2_/TRDRNA2_46122_c0_seq1.p1 gnl/TRDRNA2_/TRDRNA2_46122_c0~~gnl/TRDRNA2_/TRDRNA2_46122_c0_seq1.p1  ORF type:complete len:449 (+),score=29.46 gnl/TRDRNA2_/TRDRNA2_46122_c0_seq1:64-1410(+)
MGVHILPLIVVIELKLYWADGVQVSHFHQTTFNALDLDPVARWKLDEPEVAAKLNLYFVFPFDKKTLMEKRVLGEVVAGMTPAQVKMMKPCEGQKVTVVPRIGLQIPPEHREPGTVMMSFGWEDPSAQKEVEYLCDMTKGNCTNFSFYHLGNFWNGPTHREHIEPRVRTRYFPQAISSLVLHDHLNISRLATPREVSHQAEFAIAYLNSADCNWGFRDQFWSDLWHDRSFTDEERSGMHALGRCFGIDEESRAPLQLEPMSLAQFQGEVGVRHPARTVQCRVESRHKYPAGLGETNICIYRDYKFVVAFEHGSVQSGSERRGWMSEKVMNAFLAGSVPIFASGSDGAIDDVLNPNAVVYVQDDGHELLVDSAIRRVQSLLRDGPSYNRMLREQPLSEKGVQLLTWHSDMWARHGRAKQEQIISDLSALCSAVNPLDGTDGQDSCDDRS